MSKFITALVLAVILSAIVSFITGMNPNIPSYVNQFNAVVAGAIVGLILG